MLTRAFACNGTLVLTPASRVAQNVKVRLVERDGRPKGFGYVEFDTLDDLKDGLSLTGSQMGSRTVRVSVAEPRECMRAL